MLGKFSSVTKHACFGRKFPTGPIFIKVKTGPRIKDMEGWTDTVTLWQRSRTYDQAWR
jgi:hypothetical protein